MKPLLTLLIVISFALPGLAKDEGVRVCLVRTSATAKYEKVHIDIIGISESETAVILDQSEVAANIVSKDRWPRRIERQSIEVGNQIKSRLNLPPPAPTRSLRYNLRLIAREALKTRPAYADMAKVEISP